MSEETKLKQTVSVSVAGFKEVSAYWVAGQIAITLGVYPANLTAYLEAEAAAILATQILKACAHHAALTASMEPPAAESAKPKGK